MKSQRSKYFELIVYRNDYTHQQIIDKITSSRLECVISPYHDRDFKEDGTYKKAHYHVGVFFPTLKSIAQVYAIFKSLDVIQRDNQVEFINDVGKFIDYLTHKNNPEKAQYLSEDIVTVNGFNINKWVKFANKSTIDEDQLRKDIKQFIKENDVIYYCDLSDYASIFKEEWVDVIDKNPSFWRSYLISRQDKMRKWHEKTFLDLQLEKLALETICEQINIEVEHAE